MLVYIPFDDGSSVAFDGESFTIQHTPLNDNNENIVNINADQISMAEKNWHNTKKRLEITRALENAWNEQRKIQRQDEIRQIYNLKR